MLTRRNLNRLAVAADSAGEANLNGLSSLCFFNRFPSEDVIFDCLILPPSDSIPLF